MKLKINRQIAESHQRQFYGEDYQSVAISIADKIGVDYESDEYTQLLSGPDPGCECAFCKQAPWDN